MIQKLLAKLIACEHLTKEESERAFQIIMNGGATPAQMAAFLVALRLNGESVAEIAGAATAMRAKMETINAPKEILDVCGTGGDGSHSFNISTAVAIVVAGCGVAVAKHGNKSVSSASGSADVLAQLGVNIQADKSSSEKALNEANLCFLFAPLYHKAMRHVAPIRHELGIRTIFNLLGPLANPAKPKRQLMGVYDKDLILPMAEVLRELGSKKAWVVCGSDGMDELTITGVSYVAQLENGEITQFEITPQDAGLELHEKEDLKGAKPEKNAKELGLLLAGKKSAYRDIVLLNSAASLLIADKVVDLKQGVELAANAIDSGKAQEVLAELIRISNGL